MHEYELRNKSTKRKKKGSFPDICKKQKGSFPENKYGAETYKKRYKPCKVQRETSFSVMNIHEFFPSFFPSKSGIFLEGNIFGFHSEDFKKRSSEKIIKRRLETFSWNIKSSFFLYRDFPVFVNKLNILPVCIFIRAFKRRKAQIPEKSEGKKQSHKKP